MMRSAASAISINRVPRPRSSAPPITVTISRAELQEQIDVLARTVAENRADLVALAERVHVDRELIAELQAEGVLRREHVEQLESRTIGAATGMVMAGRQVTQDDAFIILKKISQSTNRKLREVCDELVNESDSSG